jgi:hypothetical protein
MKLPVNARTFKRCASTVLRNCLSDEHAPLDCPIRKCRRDGVCSGPLIADLDGTIRLAPADAADVPRDAMLAPVCYLHIPEAGLARVDKAYSDTLRNLVDQPGARVVESTRVIASRRWRRLDGLEG